MWTRAFVPFFHITSSAPGFTVTLSTASSANALQVAGTRQWQGGAGLSVRLSETSGVDYRVVFGSSTITLDGDPTVGMLVLGGVAELFSVQPGKDWLAIMTTSTAVSDVSVTLGYGR